MVVHRTAPSEPGSRIKDMSGDDEEVHEVPLVTPPSTHIVPEFYIFGNGRGRILETGVITWGPR